MDDLVLTIAGARGGFALRRDFIEAGLEDRDIRGAVRAGLIERLRHGTYAPAAPQNRSPEERHQLLCRAVLARLGSGYALSHYSAAVMHTPVSWGVDLETVHVTTIGRADRQSRTEAGVAFHSNALAETDLQMIDGVPVVRPVRAAFEAASLETTESGIVLVNAALHAGLFTQEEIAQFGAALHRWPESRTARLAVQLSDPGCESPGESRSMYFFWKYGIPRPQTQVTFTIGDGDADPRVDFDWPDHCHCGEFDGLVKYGRLNRGTDRAAVLVAEKRREDRIRSLPRGMSRWVFADLEGSRQRTALAGRLQSALDASRRLYRRDATHIPLAT